MTSFPAAQFGLCRCGTLMSLHHGLSLGLPSIRVIAGTQVVMNGYQPVYSFTIMLPLLGLDLVEDRLSFNMSLFSCLHSDPLGIGKVYELIFTSP